MWESGVLCEISKPLWKPFWGFHSGGISTAAHAVAPSWGMSLRLLKFNGGSVDDYAICRSS
jgi:hypothetical protein